MHKQVIIDSALAAAQSVLESLDNGEKPDLSNLSRWSYALARYVFHRTPQHDSAVLIESAVQELYSDTKNYASILSKYIKEVEEATADINGNEHIVYEPPFTYEWSPMQSEP